MKIIDVATHFASFKIVLEKVVQGSPLNKEREILQSYQQTSDIAKLKKNFKTEKVNAPAIFNIYLILRPL